MTTTHEASGADWIEGLRAQLEGEHAAQTARLDELSAISDDTEWVSAEGHTRSALLASTRLSLTEVTAALQRIEEGRYGLCEKCGASIPRERLEILPHARSCVPCREREGR
ncbi:MAG TPA: TraR/DksA C4-type zinc finger protein [Micromonosporaceae bacterium]|nr:TraR/DksA C4-type zinc finger protein [Micromonosporaceae bacterium]